MTKLGQKSEQVVVQLAAKKVSQPHWTFRMFPTQKAGADNSVCRSNVTQQDTDASLHSPVLTSHSANKEDTLHLKLSHMTTVKETS